eukprot:TRINITY_DN4799_c0_g1_i2.p1 TRINITY_DN4799_c0_g1~~TRINITY_DN4799_c0_g1_i2.p1  ORF type:complete len:343 (+),score=32.20 TRINITY_DN4799_c0_g1_i2:641-1669(+)
MVYTAAALFVPVTAELNSVRRERGLKELSMPEVLGSNAKMMIADTVPGLEFPRSFHPRAQFVGSLLNAAEPLDCEANSATSSKFPQFCEWFNTQRDKQRSIIYASFGTMFIPKKQSLEAVFRVLKRLTESHGQWSVVWSTPAENYKYLPKDAVVSNGTLPSFLQNDRFLFQNWVPQASLLAHNSTKMFITHCGMGGTLESLVSSVPLICIPIWADQFGVATRVVAAGAGLQFKNGHVREAELEQAIERTLTDASFKRHAGRLAKLLKFAGGANKAADLILLFLETGGQGEHLVNYFDIAPSWRYQLTLVSVFVFPLLLLGSVAKRLWSLACSGAKAAKTKAN